MNETTITFVGNVVTEVTAHETAAGTEAASFRLAATSRRYDKGIGAWVDGDTSFVRVTCWRRLARHVRESLSKGDPVIVTGTLKVREWDDRDGNRRTGVDVVATSVGHDLARGVTVFTRPPRAVEAPPSVPLADEADMGEAQAAATAATAERDPVEGRSTAA
jgi:single-strand DNA-binding protein